MKSKFRLLGVAAILVAVVLIAGSFANNHFVDSGRSGILDMNTMRLSIGAMESRNLSGLVPGAEVKLLKNVYNDADYPLYTRVTIYKFWEDGLNDALDPSVIGLYAWRENDSVPLTEGTDLGNGWKVWYSDEEQAILYYIRPLAPGEQTGNVIDSLRIRADIGNEHQGKSIHLELHADAIQAAEVESAMPAAWGVHPSLDDAGNITAITE